MGGHTPLPVPECCHLTPGVPCITGYESRACSDSEESSELDCVLEPLSDRQLLKLGPCRPLVEEELPPGDSPTPEVARRGPSISGASSMTDSAESEASDSANTESRGCRTSGSSESMDALEEDDLDTCSSSRSGFFHSSSPGFPETLGSNSQEERSRIETSGFLCLLDLAQRASPPCQKTEFSESPAPETFSWGPELSAVRLDPGLYEGSRTDYYSLCSGVSLARHLSDSSESTASRQGGGLPACAQQPSSALETLAPHLPLALEDGSSDEEYYDAADKLTPPDALSGEPSPAGLQTRQAAPEHPQGQGPSWKGKHRSKAGSLSLFEKAQRGSVDQVIMSVITSSQCYKGGSENCRRAKMGGANSTGKASQKRWQMDWALCGGQNLHRKGFDRSAQQREVAASLLTLTLH